MRKRLLEQDTEPVGSTPANRKRGSEQHFLEKREAMLIHGTGNVALTPFFYAYVRADLEKWRKVAREANIIVE